MSVEDSAVESVGQKQSMELLGVKPKSGFSAGSPPEWNGH
jgi:hypothetical protein